MAPGGREEVRVMVRLVVGLMREERDKMEDADLDVMGQTATIAITVTGAYKLSGRG